MAIKKEGLHNNKALPSKLLKCGYQNPKGYQDLSLLGNQTNIKCHFPWEVMIPIVTGYIEPFTIENVKLGKSEETFES